MHGLVTSPRLRGEVDAKRRVRGTLRESESVERAPHPNPLPVKNGESDCLAGQAVFGCHGVLSRRIALRMVSSFRATATMATSLFLPAATSRSRNSLRVGL